MPPFNDFTTKARDVIRRAHELAVERGQNHVNPTHLLTALVLDEESVVVSILDRLEVDSMALAEAILDQIEPSSAQNNVVSPSYQLYLTPELGQILGEVAPRIAQEMKDNPQTLKEAPFTTPVRRLDEVLAARNPILKWKQ